MDRSANFEVSPKRKISLFGVLVTVFAGLIILMLSLPSASGRRIIKAKHQLVAEYPLVSHEKVSPLLTGRLLLNGQFINDAARRNEIAIFVFRPKSGAVQQGDTLMYEFNRTSQPYRLERNQIPIAVLLAPEPGAVEWTLFSKIWISKVLQNQRVKDLLEIGSELSTNPKIMPRLKAIWKAIPRSIQEQSETILAQNRVVAKNYPESIGFYIQEKVYSIAKNDDLGDFLWTYYEAYPEKRQTKNDY